MHVYIYCHISLKPADNSRPIYQTFANQVFPIYPTLISYLYDCLLNIN